MKSSKLTFGVLPLPPAQDDYDDADDYDANDECHDRRHYHY
jgi:hypothetical protein